MKKQKVYCKNCIHWIKHYPNTCKISDFGYFKLKDWEEESELSKALGLEKPDCDNNALRFVTDKGIDLENFNGSKHYLRGIPSIFNNENDCYFYVGNLGVRISKSIVGEFSRYNLLINGFMSERSEKDGNISVSRIRNLLRIFRNKSV